MRTWRGSGCPFTFMLCLSWRQWPHYFTHSEQRLKYMWRSHQFRLFTTVEDIDQRITKRVLPCSECRVECTGDWWAPTGFVGKSPRGTPHFKDGPFSTPPRTSPGQSGQSETALFQWGTSLPGFTSQDSHYLWSRNLVLSWKLWLSLLKISFLSTLYRCSIIQA